MYFISIIKPFLTHWSWLWFVLLPDLEIGFTADVTGRQGMLTPPWHLIPLLVYPEVRVFPILWFVFPTELMRSMTVCYTCHFICSTRHLRIFCSYEYVTLSSCERIQNSQILLGTLNIWNGRDLYSSKSLFPDYTVGIREDGTIPGSPRRPVPSSKGSKGRPPSSPRCNTPNVVRPLQGSLHF
jgi:hypothetical protein